MDDIVVGDKVVVISEFWRQIGGFRYSGVYTVQDVSTINAALINDDGDIIKVPLEKLYKEEAE